MRSRRPRWVAAAAAALVVVPGATGALSAHATSSTPASGSAGDTLTLVRVANGATWVEVGKLAATTSTVGSVVSKIVVTPAETSATGAIGQQVLAAPANKSVGGSTVSLPGGLASAAGPALAIVADTTPKVTATANSLGTLNVLGVPLSLGTASLSVVSKVTGSAATAQKDLTVSSLGLPSIADLLSSLGLDLSKLTQDQLTALVQVVESTLSSTITTLNTTIDGLQSQIPSGSTLTTVAAATAAKTAATTDLATKNTTLTSAINAFDTEAATLNLTALNTALAAASLPTFASTPTWATTSASQLTVLETLDSALTSLAGAVDTAQAAVDAAQTVLTELGDLVTNLLNLVTAVTDALSADPLAALGGIHLSTSAVAAGTPTADAVATVGSLDVLGVAKSVSSLTSALAAVTGPLTTVLDSLGTGVSFTPPTIALASASHGVGSTGATKTAQANVSALRITMPTLTLPASLKLANAPASTSTPTVIQVGSLTDAATYTPASAATTTPPPPQNPPPPQTPPTTTPDSSMPNTGLASSIPLAALVLLGAALVAVRMRRRAG